MSRTNSGGYFVARTLRALGAELIFSVSGNQILPIYDAIRDSGLRVIHMRHESAAAFAAAGAAEMTLQPGVVLTSAGPAFLAALTGVATVRHMELPLLFLSGASPIRNHGFGNFQELDQSAACRPVCKDSLSVSRVESIPEILAEAWQLALSGIPGPVHVALPADVLLAESAAEWRPLQVKDPPAPPLNLSVNLTGLDEIARRLLDSRRPLVFGRPAAARGLAAQKLDRLAANLGVKPVVTGPPRGLADAKYSMIMPHYKRSDCALLVGPSDYALGFLDPSLIAPEGSFLLIDHAGDPAPKRKPDVRVQADVLPALEYLVTATTAPTALDKEWADLWNMDPPPVHSLRSGTGVPPIEVARKIRSVLKPEDVLVVDGGEFCQWMRAGLHDLPNRWYWNSKFGIIGNSIPMSIGIRASGTGGRVFAIMGDGAAGYHLPEFETAARHKLPFIGIIGNDAKWGAEWHLQYERYGPDRTFDTELTPARYDQAAAGFGAVGFYAVNEEELAKALESAIALDAPVCINVRTQSLRSPSAPP